MLAASVSCRPQIEPFLEAAGGPAAAAVSAGALAADIRGRGMKAAVALAVGTGVEAVLPLLQAGAVDMVRAGAFKSTYAAGLLCMSRARHRSDVLAALSGADQCRTRLHRSPLGAHPVHFSCLVG